MNSSWIACLSINSCSWTAGDFGGRLVWPESTTYQTVTMTAEQARIAATANLLFIDRAPSVPKSALMPTSAMATVTATVIVESELPYSHLSLCCRSQRSYRAQDSESRAVRRGSGTSICRLREPRCHHSDPPTTARACYLGSWP